MKKILIRILIFVLIYTIFVVNCSFAREIDYMFSNETTGNPAFDIMASAYNAIYLFISVVISFALGTTLLRDPTSSEEDNDRIFGTSEEEIKKRNKKRKIMAIVGMATVIYLILVLLFGTK